MESRSIIVSVFLSLSINAFTQNINVDYDCMRFNIVTFAQYLIDFKGKDFVSELLENDIYFVMSLKVDSSGHVLNLENIRSKQELPEHFKEELSCRFKTHPVSFYICYQYSPGGISKKEYCDLLKKEWINEDKLTAVITVGFPAELVIGDYKVQKDKAKERGESLSKYDYLISVIKEYKNKHQKNTTIKRKK
jgi:hypothetical protein